jgi:hypothetical protein
MRCLVCGVGHANCGEYGLKYKPIGFVGEFKPAEETVMAIVELPRKRGGDKFTSDRRLYLNGEGNVVEADNPKRKTLLVGEGGQLDMAKAREHGLIGEPAESEGVQIVSAELEGDAAEPAEGQAINAEDNADGETAKPVEGQSLGAESEAASESSSEKAKTKKTGRKGARKAKK